MINTKDVITMRVPFPNISSDLAVKKHMYICQSKSNHDCKFVKCQTLKPRLIAQNVLHHFVRETSDLTRNPFVHPTLIDCDKLFVSNSVIYDLRMRTHRRPDVCADIVSKVSTELQTDGFNTIDLNQSISQLISLNTGLISPIE